ncbi:unnamed protein product [marine sediment metagenome]|uniref:FAD-binding domain-containing protein n=1 Tax=marine sediment metagenome TaxID=412755 RepID=X0YLG5_9ZZZZ
MVPTDSESLYCDVCIIGGNIAGSYLAYLLSDSKIDVIVVEEHKSAGSPLQCAGIVSQKITNLIDLEKNIVINRIKTANLIDSYGNSISISPAENPYVIDRVKLDRQFFVKAKNHGVRFLFSEKFLSYTIIKSKSLNDQNFVAIQTNNRLIYSKLIVGCDGPRSKVARLNGVRNNLLFGMQVRTEYDINHDTIQMIFNHVWNDLFGWIIPEGNGICRIGIGVKSEPKRIFNIFLDEIGIHPHQIINRQGGFIPYGYCNNIAFERCILLGDSACMVKATTGGGIVILLSAAKIAKQAIISAVRTNNFSKKKLVKEYTNNIELKRIKRELKIHYIARLILSKFKHKEFERTFTILNDQKVKNTINIYGDMDFPKRFIIKLLFIPKILLTIALILMKNPFLIFRILWVFIIN